MADQHRYTGRIATTLFKKNVVLAGTSQLTAQGAIVVGS
jgi:hypothetical protein